MNLEQNVRMHGASNRFFIHIGGKEPSELLHKLQGADGLLLVQSDANADAFMRIINADGSEAQQCGNGLRCVALHLVRSKLVESKQVSIRTFSGTHSCLVRDDCNEVEVTLSVPKKEGKLTHPEFPELEYINMGNPNAVYWTDDDPLEIRDKLGDQIASSPHFIQGMNVHFARRDGEQYATCASFERGVGNTHASGTGGASVFVASGTREPFNVSSLGGTLRYHYNDMGEVVMAGPAGYE